MAIQGCACMLQIVGWWQYHHMNLIFSIKVVTFFLVEVIQAFSRITQWMVVKQKKMKPK